MAARRAPGHLVPAGRAGQPDLGAGRLGVRRVPRRDLRPGAELAVRRARGGPALRGGRGPARVAGPDLADAAAGPGPAGRAGGVPDRHGAPAGLAGPRVLAGYLGWRAGYPGRPGPGAGRDPAAAGPVVAAVRLRLARPCTRVCGQPGRGDRARGHRAGVPGRPAPRDRPGSGRLHGPVPAGLGADRGPGVPRRPGRRPGQHDPDGAAGGRRLPRPHPRPGRPGTGGGAACRRGAGGRGARRRCTSAGGWRTPEPVAGAPRARRLASVADRRHLRHDDVAGCDRRGPARRGPDGRRAGHPGRQRHPGSGHGRGRQRHGLARA